MTDLTDGEIRLLLREEVGADPSLGRVRARRYDILRCEDGARVGEIDLRFGSTRELELYGGHIGYGVEPEHRGRGYATKACLLARPLFLAEGMEVIWITCNPDNWPSRKTCERLGAELVEIVALPPENDQYQEGERQKCRYRWTLRS